MRISITALLLFFFSISNAQISMNMTLLDQWDVDTLPTANGLAYNDVWGYVDCDGSEYAILGSASRVHFINVTDPTDIQEVANFEGGELTIWRDMKTYKDRAYAISENTTEGLMIFDLSGLPNTVEKSYQSNEHFNKAHNIYIDEANGRLYVVGTDTQNNGVIVFDLESDLDNPSIIGSVDFPGGGYVHDIYVKDNIAYCSHGYEGFYIWDMNDAANPVLIASQVTGGYNHSSWLSEDGTEVFYAEEVPTGLPLGVIDVSQMQNSLLEITNTFKFPLLQNDSMNTPHNPYVRGEFLITSYYEDGLQVFDISDSENPMQIGYYDTHPSNTVYTGYSGNWGTYPFFPSGNILASDIQNGLFVLSLDGFDLAPIEVPTPPDISQFFPNTLEYCSGDIVNLEIPPGADEYEWFKDGVQLSEMSNVIVITESGVYSAIARTKQCESVSNEIVVIENEYPDLSLFPTQPSLNCGGISIFIEVPNGYDSYVWFQNGMEIIGENTNVLEVTESGNYSLIATNNGCETESNSVQIGFDGIPNIEINPLGPTIFCEGNFINLEAETSLISPLYEWVFDSTVIGTNETVVASENGIYQLLLTDVVTGCTVTESIEITVYEPIIPTLTLDVNTLTSSNANYYQWFGNSEFIINANQQSYTVTESGWYYIATFDIHGCAANSDSIFVDYFTSVSTIENVNSVDVFPNPTDDIVNIVLDILEAGDYQFELWSIDGRLLLEKSKYLSTQSNTSINLSSFSQGIYFIKIKNERGEMMRKVVRN